MGPKKERTGTAYTIKVSESALENIEEITSYIAFVNLEPLSAIKVGDKIFSTFDRIGLWPFSFKECDVLPTKTKMYRQAQCLSWYIIYRLKGFEITILGVIHTSKRPSRIKSFRKIK